jgi:hypothetical protein
MADHVCEFAGPKNREKPPPDSHTLSFTTANSRENSGGFACLATFSAAPGIHFDASG